MLREIVEKESPFQPGSPVSPKTFKGRNDIIEDIAKYMPSVTHGTAQHFFITGKRGMGKTSLANYLIDLFERKYKLVGIHIINDGIHDVDSLITLIVEKILNKIENESWSDKIIDSFKNHIDSVGFMGTTIKFKPDDKSLNIIKDNFPKFLMELTENFKDKKGILIVIDDINGLSDNEYFANWYKSFSDTLTTNDYAKKCPISFILTGYPEKLRNLHNQNPSFKRIFKYYNLEKLGNDEVHDFYDDIFKSLDVSYDEKAMKNMIEYSSGMPTMMQEIGDAIFWLIGEDKHINIDITVNGIIEAGNRISFKYLQPLLDERIRSENYINIFEKIGEYVVNSSKNTFTKKELESLCNKDEIHVFKDFLFRAKQLKIIELVSSNKQGEYQFTNQLYPIYLSIQKIKESYK